MLGRRAKVSRPPDNELVSPACRAETHLRGPGDVAALSTNCSLTRALPRDTEANIQQYALSVQIFMS